MKVLIFLLLLLGNTMLYGQTMHATWQEATLVNAQQIQLTSQYTKQNYLIQVTAVGKMPQNGYPVLYILDGNAFFPFASSLAQGFNIRADEHGVNPMLIVGIGYSSKQFTDLTARSLDYTPKPNPAIMNAQYQHGGAEQFHQFIEDELKPLIAQTWQVNPKLQGLFGHSYGGLYTLYNLLKYQDNYSHYFIASPSIWWNNYQIKQDIMQFKVIKPSNIYVTVGEYEQTVSPKLKQNREQRQQQLSKRAMVDSVQELSQYLNRLNHQLNVESVIYPQATHIHSAFLSLESAIMHFSQHCLMCE